MSNQLITALHIPHFLAVVARRRWCAVDQGPLAVTTAATDRAVVIDHCPIAQQAGIRPGISAFEARRRSANIHLVVHDPDAAQALATTIEAILLQHSHTTTREACGTWIFPLIALGQQYQQADLIGQQIQRDLQQSIELACALGMAATPQVARIAAVIGQPPARTVLLPGTESAWMAPLPVRLLPGVGPTTATELSRLGITTIGKLAALAEHTLESQLGPRGRTLVYRARGLNVDGGTLNQPDRRYMRETAHLDMQPAISDRDIRATTIDVTERIGRALRRSHLGAGRLTVQLGLVDGRTMAATLPLQPRRDLDTDLALASFEAVRQLRRRSRLAVCTITVEVEDLGPIQLHLLGHTDDRPYRRQQAIDHIKERYGTGAIKAAWLLDHQRERHS